jgi:hypothetical protein
MVGLSTVEFIRVTLFDKLLKVLLFETMYETAVRLTAVNVTL